MASLAFSTAEPSGGGGCVRERAVGRLAEGDEQEAMVGADVLQNLEFEEGVGCCSGFVFAPVQGRRRR
jgi:hypothetical protein